MSYKWIMLPQIRPRDVYGEELIGKYPDFHPVIWQLLHNRGIMTEKGLKEFFHHELDDSVSDPFLFRQMDEAADLAIRHIKAGSKITVFGDYDADGVTASAVVVESLRIFKADCDAYIPHRVWEGYGMNKKAIKKIAEGGTKLMITVDNGIRNKDEVAYAKSLGMDVIVTDHHQGPSDPADLPACPVINPVVAGEEYPSHNLAGVGVAYKFVQALVRRSKLSSRIKEALERRILDLVSLGTVADCVSLSGENRFLVKMGLEMMNSTDRIGLKELIRISMAGGNGKGLDTWNIGFQLAPRINAAGRLDHARIAFELLTTKDAKRAEELSKALNDHNGERQNLTDSIVENIVSSVSDDVAGKKIIIAVSPSVSGGGQAWNEGVIGLVAGRITEKFYLPTMVITESEGVLKGSGRSIPEFNIAKAVEECRGLLVKSGGHPAACGFSLTAENLGEFTAKMAEIAERELGSLDLSPALRVEAELGLDDVTESLVKQIGLFSPFGLENEQPRFLTRRAYVADRVTMGSENKHIKFRLKSGNSFLKSAIGFYQADKWKDIAIGDEIDIVYHADLNEWNGRSEAQMKILDINKSI